MVEGTPLLRVQAGNRLEGSNPFVSAITFLYVVVNKVESGLAPSPFAHVFPHLIWEETGA